MGEDDRGPQWFEDLFAAHFDRVLEYALLRTDAQTARDVAAQTFLVAWRRRDRISTPVLPWLLVVARNLLSEQRRSARRRGRLLERLTRSYALNRPTADPAEAVTDRDSVLLAFLDLSESDRDVLRLVAWDGLSNEDAAAVTGCSPAAFAVRLSRARRRLETRLATHEAEPTMPCRPQLEAT